MKKNIMRKYLFFLGIFIVTICSTINVKAQMLEGATPGFTFLTPASGSSVDENSRIKVVGYFFNAGASAKIPAEQLKINISWPEGYLQFDGLTTRNTDGVVASIPGIATPIVKQGNITFVHTVDIDPNLGTVEFAFFLKGVKSTIDPDTKEDDAANITANLVHNATPTVVSLEGVTTGQYFGLHVAPSSPLPVKISSFDAQKVDCNNVLVKWTAENAVKFDHFEVERSIDGRTFGKVGSVAFNPGTAAYSFIDKQLADGAYQYRLRCVDTDGKSQIDKTKTVSINCGYGDVTVYPTLVTSQISVKGINNPVRIKVYSMQGALLLDKPNVSSKQPVYLNNLASGNYTVHVWQKDKLLKSVLIVKM